MLHKMRLGNLPRRILKLRKKKFSLTKEIPFLSFFFNSLQQTWKVLMISFCLSVSTFTVYLYVDCLSVHSLFACTLTVCVFVCLLQCERKFTLQFLLFFSKYLQIDVFQVFYVSFENGIHRTSGSHTGTQKLFQIMKAQKTGIFERIIKNRFLKPIKLTQFIYM